MTHQLFPDVVRWLVIGLAAVTAGATVTVLRLHYQAWRRAPNGSGILPFHVAVISVAHLMFVVGSAVGVIDRLNAETLSWRTPLFGVASILTLVALYVIGGYERRRVQQSTVRVVTTEVETVKVDNSDTPPGGTRRDEH